MSQNSKIEWCDDTKSLWWGCTAVNAGCNNCYAETLSKRWGNNLWGNDKPRKVIDSFFPDLLRFQKIAKKNDKKRMVFINSMSDIFEKPMPLINSKNEPFESVTTDDLRRQFFTAIDLGTYPDLIFLLLTKRPSNINKYIPESWKTSPPYNVIFGTSVVDQATADTLIPQLLSVSGKRFLSVEPQLGQIDLTGFFDLPISDCEINWVIQGGESGRHRRPFDLRWAYSMKGQCQRYGVPYFFKQIDKVLPIPEDLMIREFPVNQNPKVK